MIPSIRHRYQALKEVLPQALRFRGAELAQLLSLSSYVLFAGAYLRLSHFNLASWSVAICAGILTEWILSRINTGADRAEKRFRISAAYISSTALFLLVEVDSNLAISALCASSILLKRFVVDDRGHHFFNPASLAIILSIGIAPNFYLFDPTRIPVRQDFFLLVILMGSISTIMARRWRLSLSYLLSFIIGSLILSLIIDPASASFRMYRVIGPMNLIFCFHMISDPVTSPHRPRDQILVGISLGMIDLILRELRIYHSTLVAMLLIAGWRGFYGMVFREAEPTSPHRS